MSGATQTRTWNDANGDKTILNADGSVQTNEVHRRHVELRAGHVAARSGPGARLQLGVQRGAAARDSAAPVGHRRLLPPRLLQPPGERQPEPGSERLDQPTASTRRPTRGCRSPGQPIPMYTLNTNKVGVATDTLVTFSTQNKTTYNGVEFTANARARQVPVVRRRHDRSPRVDDLRRDTSASTRATTRTACASATPSRRSARRSRRRRAYTFPYDIQRQRNVFGDSGTGHQRELHRDVSHRGPPDHRCRRPDAASTVVNLVEPGTLFLDYQNRLDMRLGKTFRVAELQDSRVHGHLQRGATAGTVIRVNETYAASGTNSWQTPTGIMDGRYIRFGLQMNF